MALPRTLAVVTSEGKKALIISAPVIYSRPHVMVLTSNYNLLARATFLVLPANRGAWGRGQTCHMCGKVHRRRNYAGKLEEPNIVQYTVIIPTDKVA